MWEKFHADLLQSGLIDTVVNNKQPLLIGLHFFED